MKRFKPKKLDKCYEDGSIKYPLASMLYYNPKYAFHTPKPDVKRLTSDYFQPFDKELKKQHKKANYTDDTKDVNTLLTED